MAVVNAPDLTGKVVDGRYTLEGVLGRGGMGAVYRARHVYTGAQVAVKLLHPDLSSDPELRQRFLAEARAPNAIGHHGIVNVLDAGHDPGGMLYLVMELLAGRSLRQAAYGRTLPPAEVRRIGLELLDALAAAHAHHIVHRDLKPENVFLVGPAATVKLLDFGIAKLLDAGVTNALTATGVLLGTVTYMAPEQLQDAARVDARADVWAVGAILYELLTGRMLYGSATTVATMLVALATQEPDPIRTHWPAIDPATEAFFARALARDRTHRFASAAEMRAAFAAVPLAAAPERPAWTAPAPVSGGETMATGYPPPAPYVPSPVAPVAPRPPPKSRAALWIALAAVVGVSLAAIGYVVGRPGDKHETRTERRSIPDDPDPDPPKRAKPPKVDKPPTEPELSVDEGCARGCQTMVTCGIFPETASCVSSCKKDPKTFTCLRTHHESCREIAMCGMQETCADIPHGTASCRETTNCSTACADKACSCRCMADARASEVVEIYKATMCVALCLRDKTCIETRCRTTCIGK